MSKLRRRDLAWEGEPQSKRGFRKKRSGQGTKILHQFVFEERSPKREKKLDQ